jgi:uncharacterized membrane protein (UPF0127 family)
MRTIALPLGGQELQVYLATDPLQWGQGLVGQSLDVDGMLFRFSSDVRWPFHMAGMATPILVAYFNAAGQLTEIAYLAVGAAPHTPAGSYRYALELIGDHATADGAIDLLPDLFAGLAVPVP